MDDTLLELGYRIMKRYSYVVSPACLWCVTILLGVEHLAHIVSNVFCSEHILSKYKLVHCSNLIICVSHFEVPQLLQIVNVNVKIKTKKSGALT